MNASNAAKATKNALVNSGVLESIDRKVTATMIRKLVTTLVREDEPELAPPLPQQLNHWDRTGEANYMLKQSQKSSANVVRVISKTISKAAAEEKIQKVDAKTNDAKKGMIFDPQFKLP